uniref:Uncharacterized protein n=1 Tax=Nelumbo nucifera TaxID=4432 RepID=A0A822ZRY9_NELNU|nr:TPA_asm: hypothetical protein HUJ06_017177 [Nelumbo nucifera]
MVSRPPIAIHGPTHPPAFGTTWVPSLLSTGLY